jgi:hypothetical protein
MPKEQLFDVKCFELAEHFLSDEKDLSDQQRKDWTRELAAHIQDAIESWLEYELGVLRQGHETT